MKWERTHELLTNTIKDWDSRFCILEMNSHTPLNIDQDVLFRLLDVLGSEFSRREASSLVPPEN